MKVKVKELIEVLLGLASGSSQYESVNDLLEKLLTIEELCEKHLKTMPNEGLISPIPRCDRCGRSGKYSCEVCEQELCEFHADIHSSPPHVGGCVT